MNKTILYVFGVILIGINLLLGYLLYSQNKNIEAYQSIVEGFGKQQSNEQYLKNIIGEFYAKEGTIKENIYGRKNGIEDTTLSDLISGSKSHKLIFEAKSGDCSQCVDSVLHALGQTDLQDHLIFISTFRNYGTINMIKKENRIDSAVFFDTFQEINLNGNGNPVLYLVDKNRKTSLYFPVDYKHMDVARSYLQFMETKLNE